MKVIIPMTITSSMLTASNVPETDYAEYSAGTSYAIGNRVIVVVTHKIYESLIAGNTGNYPPTDVLLTPPHWLEISATNKWKAFDSGVSTQTSQSESITYQITAGRIFDSLAFINMDAAQINVVLTDPSFGEVYNQTVSLMTTTVIDWYSYFFSGIVVQTTDYVFSNLPPYLDAVLDITITYQGSTAKAGVIVLGFETYIGKTQYMPSIGIKDYSVKDVDDFGNATFIPGAYSKKMTCDVNIPYDMVDQIVKLLSMYTATPIVYIGTELYSSMIIYGKFNDFSVVIPHLTFSECSIEIEGLI